MKKILLELLGDLFNQAVGIEKKREGKLGITYFGQKKMLDSELTYKTLEEVFRYGELIQTDEENHMSMYVRKYHVYSVGITCQLHTGDDRYMITNCWVRKWKKVK